MNYTDSLRILIKKQKSSWHTFNRHLWNTKTGQYYRSLEDKIYLDVNDSVELNYYFKYFRLTDDSVMNFLEKSTNYEPIFTRLLLCKATKIVETILELKGYSVPQNILVGTVIGLKLNGEVTKTIYGDYLITLSSKTLAIISNFSDIFVNLLMSDGFLDLTLDENKLKKRPEMIDLFNSSINSYKNHTSLEIKFYNNLEDSSKKELFYFLNEVTILFLLAHEYSHIILNHLSYEAKNKETSRMMRKYTSGITRLFLLTAEQQNELEADKLAFDIVFKYLQDLSTLNKSVPQDIIFFILPFYFNLINFVLETKPNPEADNGEYYSSTHLNPRDRLDFLIMHTSTSISPDFYTVSATKIAQVVETFLRLLNNYNGFGLTLR